MIKRIFFLICVYALAGCGSGGGDSASSLVPSIGLSVPARSFDSPACEPNPASQTFQIANAGQGTFAWSISNRPSWLLLTPESGTAPSAVTGQVNAAGRLWTDLFSDPSGDCARRRQHAGFAPGHPDPRAGGAAPSDPRHPARDNDGQFCRGNLRRNRRQRRPFF